MDINQSIRIAVLNYPEILELRKDVLALKFAPAPEQDEDAIKDLVNDSVETYLDNELERKVEYAVENVDISDQVESVIEYGYIDFTSKIDVGDLDLTDNGEFTSLQDRVEALEDKSSDDAAVDPDALQVTIDNLNETVEELTSALDEANDKIADILSRLDNASISI